MVKKWTLKKFISVKIYLYIIFIVTFAKNQLDSQSISWKSIISWCQKYYNDDIVWLWTTFSTKLPFVFQKTVSIINLWLWFLCNSIFGLVMKSIFYLQLLRSLCSVIAITVHLLCFFFLQLLHVNLHNLEKKNHSEARNMVCASRTVYFRHYCCD